MIKTTYRAADFGRSIGVQAQLNYTDGAYRDSEKVLADLAYIGVSLVRTSVLYATKDYAAINSYKAVADAGVRFDLIAGGNKPLADTMTQIDAFVVAHPGALYAVEGPNEVDHTPLTYKGLTGTAAAIAYQNDLYQAVTTDPLLTGVPVYSFSVFSGGAPTSGYSYAAEHPYPARGAQPLNTLFTNMAYAPDGAASVVSETGYPTLPRSADGVDNRTQAKLILNMVFDAAREGVQTTYIYQLLDAYADPTQTLPGNHYGLFDIGNNPKPAATALHNMTTILSDAGATAASFATADLNYSIANAPITASSMVIEKSNGVYDLVLWNEPRIWDNATHTAITAPTVNETVTLAEPSAQISVYDPLTGTTSIQDVRGASSIVVAVPDHPIIVEISGLTQADAPAPQPGNIYGTRAADQIVGTAYADQIHGVSGNDVIAAGAGDDVIEVGAGKSQVDGGDGFDTLSFAAATAPVSIHMGASRFQMFNADTAVLFSNIEAITGSPFNDTFIDSSGDDTMSGGDGDDSFTSVNGHDRIDGGAGTDTLSFASATHGVSFSGLVTTAQALDAAWSVQVQNVEALTGSAYDDVLVAGNTGFKLSGGLGDDLLVSGAGDDRLSGDGGSDTASYANAAAGVTVSLASTAIQNTGGGGRDTLSGIENLIGSAFADTLTGSAGANRIEGGGGADVLIGGGGLDTLVGGAGADRFTFKTTGDSAAAFDTISDFSSAEGDKIDLSAIDANTRTAGNSSFTIVAAFTHAAGQLTTTSERWGYLVQADVNGDGVADFGIHVMTQTALGASDFFL